MRLIYLAMVAVMLVACNLVTDEKNQSVTTTSSVPEYMAVLAWAKSADASKDATAAIAKKDYRLWSIAGRGLNIPGIDISQREWLDEKCGTQIIQGSTDVVRDEQHMALLKQAYTYAETYNQIVAKVCP